MAITRYAKIKVTYENYNERSYSMPMGAIDGDIVYNIKAKIRAYNEEMPETMQYTFVSEDESESEDFYPITAITEAIFVTTNEEIVYGAGA